MSEKISSRPLVFSSPRGKRVRANAHANHAVTQQKQDKQTETTGLNFTLVGSPAPRSQIRTTVCVGSTARPKITRHAPLQRPRSKEIDRADPSSMEKLFQFADDPTRFVQAYREEQLKLDLEFSDRSEESNEYYDSRNIAFGQNGEYRIPEYDHIRYLEFSRSETRSGGGPTKSKRVGAGSTSGDEGARNRAVSPTRVVPDIAADALDRVCSFDSAETVGTARRHSSELQHHAVGSTRSIESPRDVVRSSFDGATNYKNTINPIVEKFMLDTGQRVSDEGYAMPGASRPRDSSSSSKNSRVAPRSSSTGDTLDDSLRSSPETSRTILSGTSSEDGTWREHSLNSTYFVSTRSGHLEPRANRAWLDSGRDSKGGASSNRGEVENARERREEMRDGDRFEEKEQYLTVIRHDGVDSAESPFGNSRPYIFITDEVVQVDAEDYSRSPGENLSLNLDGCTLNGEMSTGDLGSSRGRTSPPGRLTSSKDSRPAEEERRSSARVSRDEEGEAFVESDTSSNYHIGDIFSEKLRPTAKVEASPCLSNARETNDAIAAREEKDLGESFVQSTKNIEEDETLKTDAVSSDYYARNQLHEKANSMQFLRSPCIANAQRLQSPFSRDVIDSSRTPTSNRSLADVSSARSDSNSRWRSDGDSGSEVFYMTLDEVTAAAEYSSRLSEIFRGVIRRPRRPDTATLPVRIAGNKIFEDASNQLTPRIVRTCLGSPNFCKSTSST